MVFEVAFCPGLARIGLSFPSSGGEALAGLFIHHADITSWRPSAGRIGERVHLCSRCSHCCIGPYFALFIVIIVIVIVVVCCVAVALLY